MMKVVVFLYLFVQAYAQTARSDPTNKTNINLIANKAYKLEYFSKATWFNAYLSCLNCGMKLATINSQNEQDYVEQLIKTHGYSNEEFWLAGTDLASEGHFSWFTTGKIFEYTNWDPNDPVTGQQPDNYKGNENCVHMRGISKNHKWNDISCENSYYFICESNFEC